LGGCASVDAPKPTATTGNLTVERHLLSRAIYFRSPELTLQDLTSTSPTTLSAYFRLAQSTDQDPSKESYCLYTTSNILGIGWGVFDSAVDTTDQQLDVIKSTSDVRPNGIEEEDCIQLSRAYLDKHLHTGLSIKLMASNRDIRFAVLPEDVQRFVQSVDDLKTLQKNAQ
jgi:hypothetical protein